MIWFIYIRRGRGDTGECNALIGNEKTRKTELRGDIYGNSWGGSEKGIATGCYINNHDIVLMQGPEYIYESRSLSLRSNVLCIRQQLDCTVEAVKSEKYFSFYGPVILSCSGSLPFASAIPTAFPFPAVSRVSTCSASLLQFSYPARSDRASSLRGPMHAFFPFRLFISRHIFLTSHDWILGRHRISCGHARVAKLFHPERTRHNWIAFR